MPPFVGLERGPPPGPEHGQRKGKSQIVKRFGCVRLNKCTQEKIKQSSVPCIRMIWDMNNTCDYIEWFGTRDTYAQP